MKKFFITIVILLLPFFSVSLKAESENTESMQSIITRSLSLARTQALQMAHSLEGKTDVLPRTYEKDKLLTCDYGGWVSGFFPGLLWMLYEGSRNNQMLGTGN